MIFFFNFIFKKYFNFLPKLFADGKILYAGQPYGIIAAKSQKIARLAASRVKLVFTPGPRRKPMLTVHDVRASNDKTRISKKYEWPASQSPGIANGLLRIKYKNL